VCVDLVGTGGHPRLDGGGSLLGGMLAPFQDPDVLARVTQVFPVGATDVVIIDEFDLVALAVSIQLRVAMGEGLFRADDLVTSALWPAAYGFRLDLADPRAPEETDVPHGHLVAFHALAHVAGDAQVARVVLVAEGHLEILIESGDDALRLHLVDVDFDDVATIQDALLIHGRADSEWPRFVVMSWGLVDCALAARYASQPEAAGAPMFDTLADYLTATLKASPDTGLEALLRGLCLPFEGTIAPYFGPNFSCAGANGEELALIGTMGVFAEVDARSAEVLGWTPPVGGTRFYAAAGNQALDFAMPPAAWPHVVAVEACTRRGDGLRDTRFSNRGRGEPDFPAARALGAWFASPERIVGANGRWAPLGYWGTSFATPAAALFAAADAQGDRGASPDPDVANWCFD